MEYNIKYPYKYNTKYPCRKYQYKHDKSKVSYVILPNFSKDQYNLP